MGTLRRRKEADWYRLQYGAVYRIVGAWHYHRDGRWEGGGGIVAGRYTGQLLGDPNRHLFEDTDGTTYLASSPAHTHGVPTSRVFLLKRQHAA